MRYNFLNCFPTHVRTRSLAVILLCISHSGLHSEGRTGKDIPINPNLRTLAPLQITGIKKTPTGEFFEMPANTPLFPGNSNLSWQDFLCDKTHWTDLPRGNWQLESRTSHFLKFRAEGTEKVFGVTPRHMRIHVQLPAGTIRWVEVFWGNIVTVNFEKYMGSAITQIHEEIPTPKPAKKTTPAKCPVSDPYVQNQEKRVERWGDKVEVFEKLKAKVQGEIDAQFDDRTDIYIGKTRDTLERHTDYKTPNGINLRFASESAVMVMLIAQPPEFVSKENDMFANVPKLTPGDALANIVRFPNGDVMLKNIPTFQDSVGAAKLHCADVAVFEYLRGYIPPEMKQAHVYKLDTFKYHPDRLDYPEVTTQYLAWEANMTTRDHKVATRSNPEIEAAKRTTIKSILESINRGIPYAITRATKPDQETARLDWKKQREKNPEFTPPRNSEKWASYSYYETKSAEMGVITGYNSKQGILFVTDMAGISKTNLPIYYGELQVSLGPSLPTLYFPATPSLTKKSEKNNRQLLSDLKTCKAYIQTHEIETRKAREEKRKERNQKP